MPVQGTPRTFQKKFKFVVDIFGFGSAAFNKCSELSAEVEKVEYYEGGALIPDKSPGRVKFTDITLERGATIDEDMYKWFLDMARVSVHPGVGLVDPLYKKDLAIIQKDRDETILHRWNVYGAWPVKFTAGEWDNGVDENVIEMLTLTFDYFERSTI
ncbi:MAG: phage tail protein [Spirochaetes bacterium GWB1_59_5]|nr:MAG: phage tail protein [Spirochaetes bacterium GWB1_59_5]